MKTVDTSYRVAVYMHVLYWYVWGTTFKMSASLWVGSEGGISDTSGVGYIMPFVLYVGR